MGEWGSGHANCLISCKKIQIFKTSDNKRTGPLLGLSQSIMMNIQMNLISQTALYKAFKPSI